MAMLFFVANYENASCIQIVEDRHPLHVGVFTKPSNRATSIPTTSLVGKSHVVILHYEIKLPVLCSCSVSTDTKRVHITLSIKPAKRVAIM
jgi:hypothetical protein